MPLQPLDGPEPPSGIKEKVRAVMEAEGLSQGAVAKETNIGKSALSQWLGGIYPGNSAALEARLAEWLVDRSAKEKLDGEFVETEPAQRVFKALDYALGFSTIVVITGEPGTGKTWALRRYTAGKKGLVNITLNVLNRGVSQFLQKLAMSFGMGELPWWGKRSIRLYGNIANYIQVEGVKLLVIDEAQFMSLEALEAVRGLHDDTGISVALAGNEYVIARMTGGPNSAAFAQFHSRVGMYARLNVQRADIEKLAASYGVAGKEAITLLERTAQPGGLRSVSRTLRLAAMLAETGRGDINGKTIYEAIKIRGG